MEIRAESAEQDSAIVVKDPVLGKFYRFTAVQGAVLGRLDGSQDFPSIARKVSLSHHTPVETDQITSFAEKLLQLLLLDDPATWAKLETIDRKPRRFLGNTLSIKINTFDPDDLVTRLERGFRFCFTPTFVSIVCIAIFAAMVLSVLNWNTLFVSFQSLLTISSVPLILIVACCILTLHELAHAVTLKHFGGKVNEMGFLILYFMPAFYCNVSDAWMLKKGERMWVTFAGGFFQLFLWSLATVAWRLLAPETLLSEFCLVAVAFAGIQTLFNFNPLIKLDGYYMLSDWLEVPNLRAKSFSYIRSLLLQKLLGLKDRARSRSISKREKRVLRFYGWTSVVFTTGLVGILLHRIGGWLLEEHQTWGLVLFCFVLVFMIAPIAGSGDMKASSRAWPTLVVRLRRIPLIWILLAVAVVVSFFPWELRIAGDFVVWSIDRREISPKVSGNLQDVYVARNSALRSLEALGPNPRRLSLSIHNSRCKQTFQSGFSAVDPMRVSLLENCAIC